MPLFFLLTQSKLIWATTWQNQQNECAPSEDSDQPGHPPSLIRVFAVRMKKSWVISYPLSAQRRPWSSLGAQLLCRFCREAAHMLQVLPTIAVKLQKSSCRNSQACSLLDLRFYIFSEGKLLVEKTIWNRKQFSLSWLNCVKLAIYIQLYIRLGGLLPSLIYNCRFTVTN